MRKADLLHLLKDYVHQVNAAMLLTENPSLATRSKLRTMGAQLLHASEHLVPRMGPAHAAKREKAKQDYATEPFRLHWRSTDQIDEVQGWDALAELTNLAPKTLRVQFSKGRGKLTRVLYDQHGNLDNVTIYRVNYEPGTGRPKHEIPTATN